MLCEWNVLDPHCQSLLLHWLMLGKLSEYSLFQLSWFISWKTRKLSGTIHFALHKHIISKEAALAFLTVLNLTYFATTSSTGRTLVLPQWWIRNFWNEGSKIECAQKARKNFGMPCHIFDKPMPPLQPKLTLKEKFDIQARTLYSSCPEESTKMVLCLQKQSPRYALYFHLQ